MPVRYTDVNDYVKNEIPEDEMFVNCRCPKKKKHATSMPVPCLGIVSHKLPLELWYNKYGMNAHAFICDDCYNDLKTFNEGMNKIKKR